MKSAFGKGERNLHLHSQFALLGSYVFRTSTDLLPWLVASITSGSTPSSLPIVLQCFTIAAVESMIVPSMSNSSPENECVSGAAENDGSDWSRMCGILRCELSLALVIFLSEGEK
jgi:hypothetical protein